MMLMGYWSCAVQPGTAMTAHGDDEVRRHKGCRTLLLRPRARRPSDPELPPRRSKSTYTLPHPPETARRQIFSDQSKPDFSAIIASTDGNGCYTIGECHKGESPFAGKYLVAGSGTPIFQKMMTEM